MKIAIDNTKEAAVTEGKWDRERGKALYRAIADAENRIELGVEGYLIFPKDAFKLWPRASGASRCKYPHHVVKDGKLVVSVPGLRAAYGRAKQQKVYTGDLKDHLDWHFLELGLAHRQDGEVIMEDGTLKAITVIADNFDAIEAFTEMAKTQPKVELATSQYESAGMAASGNIRPVTDADLDHVIPWLMTTNEFEGDPNVTVDNFDRGMFTHDESSQNYTYGYDVDGKIEGLIRIKLRQKNGDYLALSFLFVNPKLQGRGYGKALLSYIIDRHGSLPMRLNVFTDNDVAIGLYRKYGFYAEDVKVIEELEGENPEFLGKSVYKMFRPVEIGPNDYDPPLSLDKLPEHLRSDKVHRWRAITGIELIHREPSAEEQVRIWENWQRMTDRMKAISDEQCKEFFGLTNEEHHVKCSESKPEPKPYREDSEADTPFDSIDSPEALLSWMTSNIQYGYVDGRTGFKASSYDERDFMEHYVVQGPDELLRSRVGNCFDQVELARLWFTSKGLSHGIYYIEDATVKVDCHAFLIYDFGDKSYWFEAAWKDNVGIHEFPDHESAINGVKEMFERTSNPTETNSGAVITKLNEAPTFGITYGEYLDWARHQPKVYPVTGNSFSESIGLEEFESFTEKSHGSLKYEYRIGVDTKTGELTAVQFKLDPKKIVSVGNKDSYETAYILSDRSTYEMIKKIYGEIDRLKAAGDNEAAADLQRRLDQKFSRMTADAKAKALEKVKKTIKKTGHIDYVADESVVDKIFHQGGNSIRSVKMVATLSDDMYGFLGYLDDNYDIEDFTVKSPSSYGRSNSVTYSYKWLFSNRQIRKIFVDYCRKQGIAGESYETGKLAGKNKYRSTKIMWDSMWMYRKYTRSPAVRGYLSPASIVKNFSGYDGTNKPKILKESTSMSDQFDLDIFSEGDDGTDQNIRQIIEAAENDEPETEADKEEKPAEKEKESQPKKIDQAEAPKNGVKRKQLYLAFIQYAKQINPKNTFGSVFDKDAFKVTYTFVPEEMRYFYRLANPLLCVLEDGITFFSLAELRKVNSDNPAMDKLLIFAADVKTKDGQDVIVFNFEDRAIYHIGEKPLRDQRLYGFKVADSFDTYLEYLAGIRVL